MNRFADTLQTTLKKTSSGVFTYTVRLMSGFFLGLILALMGEQVIGYSSLSFNFVVVMVVAVFFRLTRSWGLMGVLVFDLFCFLLGLLLKMYLLVAPGA